MKKISTLICFVMSFSLYAQEPVFEWAIQQGSDVGDGSSSMGRGIATDTFGNVYTTGGFYGTGDFDPTPNDTLTFISNGSSDFYVSKLNAEGQLLWAHSFGDTLQDRGFGIVTDLAGNVYVTGYFSNTIDFDPGPDTFNLTASTSANLYILKLNTDGEFVWAKRVGNNTRGFSIAVDNDGGVYVTGIFNGSTDFDPSSGINNLTSNGGTDIFIIKLTSEGNFVWAKSVGGEEDDGGNHLAVDNEGDVYTTGYFKSTADFNPGISIYNLTPKGDCDQFILKLTSEGDFIWANKIGGEESEVVGHSLAVTEEGVVYSTGYFKTEEDGVVDFDPGTGNLNVTSSGVDAFILKLSAEGNFDWVNTISAEGDDRGFAIALDENDNLYTTGRFEGTADFDSGPDTYTLSSYDKAHAFILNLDSLGSFIWAGSLESETGLSSGFSIEVDELENIYTTGIFISDIDFNPGTEVNEMTSNENGNIFVQKMRLSCTAFPVINNGTPTISSCSSDTTILFVEMPFSVSDINYLWNTGENADSIFVVTDTILTYTVDVVYIQDSITCNNSASIEVTIFEDSDTTYVETNTCDSLLAGISTFLFFNQNGCDSIVVQTTSLISPPSAPQISSDLLISQNESPFQISVPEILDASAYFWQVPLGVQILSGQNTNTITVDWDDQVENGNICVSAINECGNSPLACMEVAIDIKNGVEEYLEDKYYSIYPNPTSNILYVVFKEDKNFEVALLDVFGRVVISSAIYNTQTQLETRELAAGNYWLKIISANKEKINWEYIQIIQ